MQKMQINTLFIEFPALRARREGPARSRQKVLFGLLRQAAGWACSRLGTRRAIADLTTMDDRLLRDIGLRHEQPGRIQRYGRLPGDLDNSLLR
jgi:uncharacterized protein YjiS (DUF1127 family)